MGLFPGKKKNEIACIIGWVATSKNKTKSESGLLLLLFSLSFCFLPHSTPDSVVFCCLMQLQVRKYPSLFTCQASVYVHYLVQFSLIDQTGSSDFIAIIATVMFIQKTSKLSSFGFRCKWYKQRCWKSNASKPIQPFPFLHICSFTAICTELNDVWDGNMLKKMHEEKSASSEADN